MKKKIDTIKPNIPSDDDDRPTKGLVLHRDYTSIVFCPSIKKSTMAGMHRSIKTLVGTDQPTKTYRPSQGEIDVEQGGGHHRFEGSKSSTSNNHLGEGSEETSFEYDTNACRKLESRRIIATEAHSQRKASAMPTTTNNAPFRSINHKVRTFLKEVLRFKIICTVYIATMTFTSRLRDPHTGLIVDQASPERTENGLILTNGTERAIVAASTLQLVCLIVARLSAWFMYPSK